MRKYIFFCVDTSLKMWVAKISSKRNLEEMGN